MSLTLKEDGGVEKDGGLEGHGIRVSAQLGPLPGTGGGPQTPKGTGGTPSDRVGRGAWRGVRGEEKWRRDETGVPERWWGKGKGSHAQRGKLGHNFPGARFPLLTRAPGILLRAQALSSAH